MPSTRSSSIERDVLIVQRASALIGELGAQLDAQLAREPRESERLRLVREATNQITRAANDAIQAYRRARRSLELQDIPAVAGDPGQRLTAARLTMLDALERAGRRYPWTPNTDRPR